MKELTSAFHSEVFRPVVSLVVPGFYATSTLSFAFWQRFPNIQKLVDDHPGTATTIMVLMVLTSGLIAEDLGARIERYFDESLSRVVGYEHHLEQWFDYLRLAFDKEPVGHRYLRTLVLRLKFELGMTVASVPFSCGALWIEAPCIWRIGFVIGSIVIAVYFWHEARCSNKALSDLRRELLTKDW